MLNEAIFKTAKLCVVGNINRDFKTAPLRAGAHLFEDGETSVAAIRETIGGGGANSAAAAASLGAEASFIGQVGVDAAGERLEQAMTRAGVRCHLYRNPATPTGATLNLVYDNGRRHFLSCHPNNAALSFEHLDLHPLRQANHLLRADLWFSEAMLFGGNEKLFQQARALGLAISVDLNWDPRWGRAARTEIQRRKQAARKLLPLVCLAHGNVRELNEFAEAGDLETSLGRLGAWGVQAVVVHMGKQGAGYYTKGKLVVAKPAPIKRPLMATGTGDILSVCLMLMHHRGDVPIQAKLRLANAIVAQFIDGRRQLIPSLAS